MKTISACGDVRVTHGIGVVIINIFGTYAEFDVEAFDELLAALDDAGEVAFE